MKFVFGIMCIICFIATAFATPIAKPIIGFGGGYGGSQGRFQSYTYANASLKRHIYNINLQ